MTIRFALIGQRIVHYRKKRDMTQLALSSVVGIGEKTMGKIEKGYDMRLSVLLAISDALDVPLPDLLDYEQTALPTLSACEREKIIQHLKAIADLLP